LLIATTRLFAMADSKDAAQEKPQQPKFDWDYDVPDTRFWRDLPFTAGRNFLACYSALTGLEDIHFDGTLSVLAKLTFLLSLLDARLETRKAAASPYREPPRVVQYHAGHSDDAEPTGHARRSGHATRHARDVAREPARVVTEHAARL